MGFRPTDQIRDTETRLQVENLQEELMPTPLSLETAPASGALQLTANQWGVNGGKLYIRIGDTVYELTPSGTIT